MFSPAVSPPNHSLLFITRPSFALRLAAHNAWHEPRISIAKPVSRPRAQRISPARHVPATTLLLPCASQLHAQDPGMRIRPKARASTARRCFVRLDCNGTLWTLRLFTARWGARALSPGKSWIRSLGFGNELRAAADFLCEEAGFQPRRPGGPPAAAAIGHQPGVIIATRSRLADTAFFLSGFLQRPRKKARSTTFQQRSPALRFSNDAVAVVGPSCLRIWTNLNAAVRQPRRTTEEAHDDASAACHRQLLRPGQLPGGPARRISNNFGSSCPSRTTRRPWRGKSCNSVQHASGPTNRRKPQRARQVDDP